MRIRANNIASRQRTPPPALNPLATAFDHALDDASRRAGHRILLTYHFPPPPDPSPAITAPILHLNPGPFRTGACRMCGAQAIPGEDYCYACIGD